MSTRALPDGFDMTQALRSPLEPQHYVNALHQAPLNSPVSYASASHDSRMIRPLLTDQFRHQTTTGGHVSPAVTRPAHYNYYTPPGSNTTSENVSPISSMSERTSSDGHAFSPSMGSQSINSFMTSSALPATHIPHTQVPRLQFRDSMLRAQTEFLSLNTRGGTAYTNNRMNYGQSSTSVVGSQPQLLPLDHSTNCPSDTGGLGQGSGFPCTYETNWTRKSILTDVRWSACNLSTSFD